MLNKISLLFKKSKYSIMNKLIRKYYEFLLLGYKDIILIVGDKERIRSRSEMYEMFKKEIMSDIHILTEDAIKDKINKENEDFKKGFRHFGDTYLKFLKRCNDYIINKDTPNLIEKHKKEVEKEMIEKIQGSYPKI